MSRSSTRRRAVGLLALALPLGLLLPVAGPAQAAVLQLGLDGESYEQHELDAVVEVAPAGFLTMTVGQPLVDPVLVIPGAELVERQMNPNRSPYVEYMGDVDDGVWVAYVQDGGGESWSFLLVVDAAAPDRAEIDLDGPGTHFTYYPDAAPPTSAARGGTLTYAAPAGVNLAQAWTDLFVDAPVMVSGADGFTASVAPDGSRVTVTLPRTAGDGTVPFAGDVDAELTLELEDAEGHVVVLGAPVTMRPHASERRPSLAVLGTNGATYTRADSPGSTYRNLGGVLVGSPAVARTADGRDLFVGQSSNGGLYVRSATSAWARLSWPNAVCSEPDAEMFRDELVVACRGGNGKAYVGRATVPANGLPFIRSLTSRGGLITGGPGLAIDTTTGLADLVVRGGAHARGNVWSSTGADPAWRRRALTCTAAPAVASAPGYSEAQTIACASTAQELTVLYSDVGKDGELVDDPVLCGPRVVGRPGLTPSWDAEHMRVHFTGPNAAVYSTDLAYGCMSAVRQPGASASGVGAAGVLPAARAEWGWAGAAETYRPLGIPPQHREP